MEVWPLSFMRQRLLCFLLIAGGAHGSRYRFGGPS